MDVPSVRRARLFVLRYRRIIAALCAGLCVLVFGQAMSAGTITIVVASTGLTAGTTLSEEHLALREYPSRLVPDQAIHSIDEALGETLNGPGAAGEPITRTRLRANQIEVDPGLVTLPLRIDDQVSLGGAQTGDRVSILAIAAEERPTILARDVLVVSVTSHEEGGYLGYVVEIAVDEKLGIELSGAAVTASFALLKRESTK